LLGTLHMKVGCHMRDWVRGFLLPAAAWALAGCGEIPELYIPATVGQVGEATFKSGIRMTIGAEKSSYVFGEPIVFSVVMKNVSDRVLVVDGVFDNELLFVWTYPDGKRDMFIREFPTQKFLTDSQIVRLEPGQTVRKKVEISTSYFRRVGVTEFHARYRSPFNSNPEIRNVWVGETISNGFGVTLRYGSIKKSSLES